MDKKVADKREFYKNVVIKFLLDQGLSLYKAEPKSEDIKFVPDFLGFAKKKVEIEVEKKIDIMVETCETLNLKETEEKAKFIAENARKADEGFMIFVPGECIELLKNKIKEWDIEDVAKPVPILLNK